jgi:predicted nucleic acid-binding protein
VVVDTNVWSARLTRNGAALEARYQRHLASRPALVSFVTLTEVRYGARWQGWGTARLQLLATHVAQARIAWPDDNLAEVQVDLRTWCRRAGHGLAGKEHEADRWIAATAMWLGVPLVSDDKIFLDVDGLEVLSA